jgi:hypothetical protein
MKNEYRVVCVAIFVVGLVVFFQAVSKPDSQAVSQEVIQPYADAEPGRSHVVTYIHTRVAPNGLVHVVGSRTRYVKADGEFREIMRGTNSKEPVILSRQSDGGVYITPSNSSERRALSKDPPPQKRFVEQLDDIFRSAEFLKNHKEFVRMDEVAGLTVFVLKAENKDGDWAETSYSPKTGRTPLKTVSGFRDGGKVIIEATKVEFIDVPDDLNEDIEALPVKPK